MTKNIYSTSVLAKNDTKKDMTTGVSFGGAQVNCSGSAIAELARATAPSTKAIIFFMARPHAGNAHLIAIC